MVVVEGLVSLNRQQLWRAFNHHCPSKEGLISSKELLAFAHNVLLVPDILSRMELLLLLKQQGLEEGLSYTDFEHLLSKVAADCFKSSGPSVEQLRLLLVLVLVPRQQVLFVRLCL